MTPTRRCATTGGPAPDGPGACPPSSLRLVLRLLSSGVEWPHPGALARGCHPALVWSCACGAPSPGPWVRRHGRAAAACCTASSRLALHDRARCPLLCPSVSPSNSPSAASSRVPEGCNSPIQSQTFEAVRLGRSERLVERAARGWEPAGLPRWHARAGGPLPVARGASAALWRA